MQKTGLRNLEVTITPIDAASINRETFEAARLDGNYEKELALVTGSNNIESNRLSKSEKAEIAGKVKGIEAVRNLEKDNLIPSNTAHQLIMKIIYGESFGSDGTETTSLSNVEAYPDDYNPYKGNRNYLSIFKVTFENKGDEIAKIKINDFLVVSGEELLTPFGIKYFEDNLKSETEKTKNVYRLNMPEELSITPSQKISKYIAIPAINPKNENLQIQIIKDKEILNYDFKVKEQIVSKNYNVENYFMYVEELEDPYHKYYYAVRYENGSSFALLDNQVYVSDENKFSPVTVYGVSIHAVSSNVRTTRKINFKFGEQAKNKVEVSFERLGKKK